MDDGHCAGVGSWTPLFADLWADGVVTVERGQGSRGHGGAHGGSGQRDLSTVIEVFQCLNHQFGVQVPSNHTS